MSAGWLKRHIAGPGLKLMLEGAYGELVELIPPDGVTADIKTNEDGNPLRGQVLRDFQVQVPESGDDVIVTETIVTLRKSALSVVPQQGETWGVRIQEKPESETPMITMNANIDEALTGGATAGFITMHLKTLEQTPAP